MKNRRLLSLLLAVVTVLSLLPLGIVGATAAEAGTLPPTLPGDPNTVYKWGHYPHPTTGVTKFYYGTELGVVGRANGPAEETWGRGYGLSTIVAPNYTFAALTSGQNENVWTKELGSTEAKAPANTVGILLKVKNNSSAGSGVGFALRLTIEGLAHNYTTECPDGNQGLVYYYDYGTYDAAFQTPTWRVESIGNHKARIRPGYDGYIYVPLEGFFVQGKASAPTLAENAELLTEEGLSKLTMTYTDWGTGSTMTVESISYVTLGDRIVGAAPILSDGVDLSVRTNVRGGAESAALVFTFEDGGEDGAPEVITLTKKNPAKGDNVFYLTDEIKAQNLTRTFDMQLYIDGELVDTVEDYCIRDYAMRMLNTTGTTTALQSVLANLLAYGAEAQEYVGYKTGDPATSQMAAYQKAWITATPSANAIPSQKSTAGDASLCDWTGVSLILNSRFALRLSFRAPGLDLSKVEVRVGNKAFAPARTETSDVYSVLIEDVITAKTFCTPLTVTLVDKESGTAIGETLTYAASDYVRSSLSNANADPAVQEMAGAAYNYAQSAIAYATSFVLDNNYAIVLPETSSLSTSDVDQLNSAVARFKENVQLKTGVALGTGNGSKRITVSLNATNTYTGYEFHLQEGAITVSLRDTARLDDAFEALLKQISSSAKVVTGARAVVGAPAWTYAGSVAAHVYSGGNESYQMYVTNTNASAFNSYCADLINKYGYTLYTENRMGENGKESIFASYRNDKFTVYVTWNPVDSFVRVTETPASAYAPDGSRDDYVAIMDTTLTQHLRDDHATGTRDNGLGMFYQLADGRFIIIDGGENATKNDHHLLYELLMERKPKAHVEPIIAAWIFTHEHGDHTYVAKDFLPVYYNCVKVEMFAANFPNFSEMFGYFEAYTYEKSSVENLTSGAIKQYYPDATIWIMHAGQKNWIGNAEVEIIYTHLDQYNGSYIKNTTTGAYGTQNESTDHNISDNVFRITVNGTSAMFLGDSYGQTSIETSGTNLGKPQSGKTWWANDLMAKWYGSYLKSDILQTAHHGLNEGLLLYQAVDPTTVIWPAADSMVDSDRVLRVYANKWLLGTVYSNGKTSKATKFYTSSYETVITLEKIPDRVELPMMPLQ